MFSSHGKIQLLKEISPSGKRMLEVILSARLTGALETSRDHQTVLSAVRVCLDVLGLLEQLGFVLNQLLTVPLREFLCMKMMEFVLNFITKKDDYLKRQKVVN